MQQFVLKEMGFDVDVDLEGELTILQAVPGAPAVFLFDEHHTTPECIEQNIANGEALISVLGSPMIGVESHSSFEKPSDATRLNEHPEFAIHFQNNGHPVYGVECVQLLGEQAYDMENRLWREAGTHPLNRLRSHYYIWCLFGIWRRRSKKDRFMFLNVGRKHNDHIATLIASGEIVHLAGTEASYVRLRPTAYPAPK